MFHLLLPLTVDGYHRPLFLVNGITPGPIIEAMQGETFVVTVNNMLAVQIGMHW
jgi:L-ascorbate oxidase